MSLLAPAVRVAGRDPLAQRVFDALRRAGRRVRRFDVQRIGQLAPGRCSVLVLADPLQPLDLLRTLAAALSARRRPLRVVLMRAVGSAVDLPADCCWPHGPLLIETLPIGDRAARSLLARWPLHLGLDPLFGQRPHLVVAGFGANARAFLVHALRLILYGGERPLVTIIDTDPDAARTWLVTHRPEAGQIADLRWLAPGLDGFGDDAPPPSLTLVTTQPPSDGLALARRIAGAPGGCAPILLEVGDAETTGVLADWDGRIIPVSFLAEVCRAEVILDGEGDELARTIHEHYTDTIAAQGRDPATEAAGQSWETLAESYREANRHQADHIAAKLAVTDCRAVPEERVHSFAFAPLEVERLAVIEHDRWSADRHMDGWSYAPVRDNARKHHPQLIPYADLSGPMKDLDRYAVRGLPALLARSGQGVVRMLIVAIPGPRTADPDRHPPAALVDQVLARLVARYPDRSLVVASALGDAATRFVATRAMAYGAGLFLLCPCPMNTLLEDQTPREREALLSLAARAERRIAVDGESRMEEWFRTRAEIRLMLETRPVAAHASKWVRLDAQRRRLEWGFEY